MIKNRILLSYNLYNHLILFKSKIYMYIHIYILIKILLEIENI